MFLIWNGFVKRDIVKIVIGLNAIKNSFDVVRQIEVVLNRLPKTFKKSPTALKTLYGDSKVLMRINNLTNQTFDNIYIALPPIEILKVFDELKCKIFSEVGVLQQDTWHLIKQRDELLPLLMNGQVEVSDVENDMLMAAEPVAEYEVTRHANSDLSHGQCS